MALDSEPHLNTSLAQNSAPSCAMEAVLVNILNSLILGSLSTVKLPCAATVSIKCNTWENPTQCSSKTLFPLTVCEPMYVFHSLNLLPSVSQSGFPLIMKEWGYSRTFVPDQRLRKFNIPIEEAEQIATCPGAHTNRHFQLPSFLEILPQINARPSSCQGVNGKEIRRLSPFGVGQVLSHVVVGNSMCCLFSI